MRIQDATCRLKGGITGLVEAMERGRQSAALRAQTRFEVAELFVGKTKLDPGPGHVPGDVLAADQIMRIAVIDGVGLDDPPVRAAPGSRLR